MQGSDNAFGIKRYFQSIEGKDVDGNDLLSVQFTKTTFHHPTLQKALVVYKGDETISSKFRRTKKKALCRYNAFFIAQNGAGDGRKTFQNLP